MLPRTGGYQRLENDDNIGLDGVNGSVELNPLQNSTNSLAPTNNPPNTLKILYKEKTFEITNISGSTTIGELKRLILEATEVELARQRLIMGGKPMRPDEATLASYKLADNAHIHLFPIPMQPVNLPVATPSATPSAPTNFPYPRAQPAHPPTTLFNVEIDTHHHLTPVHYDAYISHHGREVKMWCIILLFLSTISLFNNLTYFTATGKFGHGALDSVVFLLDTTCSALGLVVASKGLKSVQSLNTTHLREYLQYLGILFCGCVCLRVLWVWDVSEAVSKAYRERKEDEANENDNNNSIDHGDDSPDDASNPPPLTHQAVTAFTIQAVLIAAIIVGAWVTCVGRAYRLYNAVQSFERREAPPVPAPASTATTTTNPLTTAVAETV